MNNPDDDLNGTIQNLTITPLDSVGNRGTSSLAAIAIDTTAPVISITGILTPFG